MKDQLRNAFAVGWVVGAASMLMAVSIAAMLDRLARPY